jgi:hypothetical protein
MLHGTCAAGLALAYLDHGTIPAERPACQSANPD